LTSRNPEVATIQRRSQAFEFFDQYRGNNDAVGDRGDGGRREWDEEASPK